METAYHPGATWRKLADVEPREAPVQKPAVPIAGPVPAPIPDDLGAPSSAQVESPALGVHAAIAARRKASGN